MISVEDIMFFELRKIIEPDGNLIPIELTTDIPFDVKRIFYVYGVEDQNDRGKHAHHTTEQVLICIKGTVEVRCKDSVDIRRWILNSPGKALYVPNLIWDEQIYFDRDSILLVLSNTSYDKNDYIDDWHEFVKIKTEEIE
jgi:hypothetical protein